MMQLIFNITCVIFLLWMCFRWSKNSFLNSMIKVFLFLTSIAGILLVVKQLNLV